MGLVKWTDGKITEIEKLMHDHSNAEIAKVFDVSAKAIFCIMNRKGLKRTESENNSIHNRIMADYNGACVGKLNHNWKGGISKNRYRYQKIAKKRHPKECRTAFC